MDEYISRDEVLSRIYATHSTGGFANEEAYLWLHDEITNLSAEEAEPEKVWCDNCKTVYRSSDLLNIGADEGKVNFCPNCGARLGW